MNLKPTLGLLAFLAAWLLSGVASAQSLDDGCAAAAPEPLFVGSQFTPGPDNSAVESAALADARVELQVDGCVDMVERSVALDFESGPAWTDGDAWLSRADAALGELRTTTAGAVVIARMRGFIARREAARQVEDGDSLSYSACFDGSLPDEDGCPFDSGGGYTIRIEPRGAGVRVTLAEATDL